MIIERQLHVNKVSTCPVPVERMVTNYRIKILGGDLGEVSGLIVRKGDSVTIGVNNAHSLGRRRFTIAHEFGHFLLHAGISDHIDRDYRVNFRAKESTQGSNVDEIEANFFAANLLMPKKFLDNAKALDALDDEKLVKELAKKFKVSQYAMSLRLSKLYTNYTPI